MFVGKWSIARRWYRYQFATRASQMPVGRNKLAQFRQPYGKRTAAMPELRKLVPAYIFRHGRGRSPRSWRRAGSYDDNLVAANVKLQGASPWHLGGSARSPNSHESGYEDRSLERGRSVGWYIVGVLTHDIAWTMSDLLHDANDVFAQ